MFLSFRYILTGCLLLYTILDVPAQDPSRFRDQIDELLQLPGIPANHIIFTGSSSVRMWKSLPEDYPQYHVVNKGFGGSQMSDLAFYLEELVLASNPCQVFIYEGDNDLSAGKAVEEIIEDTKTVIGNLLKHSSEMSIVLIAAKPSVARWALKNKYLELNKAFNSLAEGNERVHFADVWTPAIADGMVLQDIFLNDNLHMNEKGYAIWSKVIASFLSDCALK